MYGPSVGLYQAQRVLDALFVVLGGSLWFAFALADAVGFPALCLLLERPLLIYGPGLTVGAFMNVGHMVGRLVIADDVLPCVALLTKHSISVVVRKAANALDGRRFLIFEGALQRGRAVGVG
jgi:hypothetical protein